MSKKLNALPAKQKLFVQEYVAEANATQAAIKAGYSKATAAEQGSRLLRNVKVAEVLREMQSEQSERTQIKGDDGLKQLREIALYYPLDYIGINEQGLPYIDLSKMTREASVVLKKFKVKTYLDGRGEDARLVQSAEVEFVDKLAALDKYLRQLGLFPKDGPQVVVEQKFDLTGFHNELPDVLSPFKTWRAKLEKPRKPKLIEGKVNKAA